MAISEGAVSLVVGTVLALGALSVVLAPLINGVDAPGAKPATGRSALDDDDRPATAVDALREIEFDRETGKLSDSDYAELKSRYTRAALAELREADRVSTAVSSDDAVEAAIARARSNQQSCTTCGPRPEPDATYCSSCGRYLPGACGACGTPIDVAGSRFCSGCGVQLAAA
ncbi:MAG: zinc ribbon domain-containing protein [Gemmatimonadaceae bacterium]|nr:zinc ribbon domain-containing protein [Gemmatimonadaceae bacterium]